MKKKVVQGWRTSYEEAHLPYFNPLRAFEKSIGEGNPLTEWL
jgi:hypothetical protein